MKPAATLSWAADESAFELGGLRFIEVQKPPVEGDYEPGVDCFRFHKMKPLVDQYLVFLERAYGDTSPETVLELGLFEGGSVPFWFELLGPKKHVGVDIQDRDDPPYLRDYVRERGLEDRIVNYWRTDQADAARLNEICDAEFGARALDLVIDDASHLYAQSKSSFETLFPRLRPGGLYVIEDWAWYHWRGIEETFRGEIPLTKLITELTEAAGSSGVSLIEDLYTASGFVAVRRGATSREDLGSFRLDDWIYRHPGGGLRGRRRS